MEWPERDNLRHAGAMEAMELPDRFSVAAGTDHDFLDETFATVHAAGIVALGRPIMSEPSDAECSQKPGVHYWIANRR